MMMLYNRRISRLRFNKNLHAAQIFILAATAIILTVALVAYPATVRAAGDLGISRDLESALLAENWNQVISIISGSSPGQASIMRFLKGHSCLAINRNNESFCLFIGASADDQERWRQWSQDFAKSHPSHPVAVYFKGDGLARLQLWDGALEAFTKALTLNPTTNTRALILDARGVTSVAKKDYRQASLDFQEAITANPKLADAYACRGELSMARKEGPKQALEHFTLAIKLSPEFALALHNRGCIKLLLSEPDSAMDDLEKAEQYGKCAGPLWLENRLRIMAYNSGMNREDFLAAQRDGTKPGALVSVKFERVQGLWQDYKKDFSQQGKFNTFEGNWGRMSPQERISFYNQVMAPDLKNNPGLRKQYYAHEATVWTTNKPGGWADRNMFAIGAIAGGAGVANTFNKEIWSKIGIGVGVFAAQTFKDFGNQWKAENFRNVETLAKLDKEAFPGDFTKAGINRLQAADPKPAPLGGLGAKSPPVGGVDMKLAPITDDGNWPFLVSFGLIYPVTPN